MADTLFGTTTAWALDDDVVHTNHGSFGAISTATHKAVAAARARVAANPMRFFDREHHDAHDAAVAAATALVGADASASTLVPNATIGMEVGARLLPWKPGATVVVTDQVYLSVLANLRRRAEASGARIVTVATDPWQPDTIADAVLAAVDDAAATGPVGLVVDHVASATACPFPIADIVAGARARDVVVVVDGAHVPGQYAPAEVRDVVVGADAWTGNLHKWACAPHSVAVLTVAPRHHGRVGQIVGTWYEDLSWPDNSAWLGTADPGPLLVTPQVVDQAMAVLAHADTIEARAQAGARQVVETIGGRILPGAGWMRAVALPEELRRADPVAAAMQSPPPSAVFSTPLDLAARAIEAWLVDRAVEAKVTPWGEDLLLRISSHAYSSARDHAQLAGALAALQAA